MAGIMNMKVKLTCGLLLICLACPLTSGHAADPFDNLPDPTRHHKKIVKKAAKKVKQRPLILQATLISKDSSHAIINGKSVAIGERIEGATLLTINPFEVVIEKHGKQKQLRLMSKDVINKHGYVNNDDR